MIATLPGDVIETTMRALIDRGMLPECSYRKLKQEIRSLSQVSGQGFDFHRSLQRKRAAFERLRIEIADLEERIRTGNTHGPAPEGQGRGEDFSRESDGGDFSRETQGPAD